MSTILSMHFHVLVHKKRLLIYFNKIKMTFLVTSVWSQMHLYQ